jgi:N6-L-threonylcarbamoyladenine synthase
LLVGVNFAKSLAFANNIPLVSVNHIRGHVCAAYLADKELKAPFLALVVSGGHTSIYTCERQDELCEIGTTRDDAAGEAFDKIGRVIGMPYPGGAALDKLAYEGDKNAIKLPSPALAHTIDFSFSGIKTAALNYINSTSQKGEEINRADLAASYTKAIVDAIVKQTSAAIDQTGLKRLVLAGGVAANSHLRSALEKMCQQKKVTFTVPSRALCGDNGAMIAVSGCFEYLAGNFADTSLNASALDEM